MSWKRVLKETQKGENYDGAIAAWYTKDRDKIFKFTDVVLPSAIHFIKLKKEILSLKLLMTSNLIKLV